MRRDASAQAAERVACDRLADQLLAVQAVHHRGMCAQIPAPAHTHRGEHGDVVRPCKSLADKCGRQAQRRARRAERRDRYADGLRRGKAEKRLEDEVDPACQPRQEPDPLICGAGIRPALRRAVDQHHHHRAHDEHPRHDRDAHFHAAVAALEDRAHHAAADPAAAHRTHAGRSLGRLALKWWERGLGPEMLFRKNEHQPGRDDAADHCAEQPDQHRGAERPPHCGRKAVHIRADDQPHAEGRAEIGQRGKLIRLEEMAEILILSQRQDRRIIRKERRHDAERRRPRHAVDRPHQRLEHAVGKRDEAELT